MKTLTITVFFMTTLFAAPAIAADTASLLSKEYSECMDKTEGVTFDMMDCATAETERQEKRLNAAYKKVMSSLPKGRKEALKEAQRAWLKYRESYTAYLYDPEGGQLARMNANSWHMQITAARVQELEAELEP